jgi:hypothetical protein
MIWFAALSYLLAAVSIVAPAFAQDHACTKSVTEKLGQIGVSAGDVVSIEVSSDSGSYGTGRSLVGWITLKSCDGYLMMNMRLDCKVAEAYTRKNCKLPGVSHYR